MKNHEKMEKPWKPSEHCAIIVRTATIVIRGGNMENRKSVTKRTARIVTAALMLMLNFVLSVTGVHADACTSQALVNASQDTIRIQAVHVADQGVTRSVYAQVYYAADGMSKMNQFEMIYDQNLQGWTVDVRLADLQTQKAGQYNYLIQGINQNGAPVGLSSGQFTISKSPLVVAGAGINATKGTFNAVLKGLEKATDVAGVTVTATNGNNKSYTYTATRQNNGTYLAVVDAANHDFYRGKYTLTANVTLTNGTVGTATGTFNFNPKNLFRFKDDNNGKTRTAFLYNPSRKGKVTFEVWSKTKGMDDKTTYTGKKKNTYYYVSVKLNKLKHSGTCYVRVKIGGKKVGSDYAFTVGSTSTGNNSNNSNTTTGKKNGWVYDKYNGKTYKFYYENGKKLTDLTSKASLSRLSIELNRAAGVTTVYAYDSETKSYCIPVKAFTVSVGRNISSNSTSKGLTLKSSFTPLGTYSVCSNGVAVKYSLKPMHEPDGSTVYARWATHVVGNVYFHAIAVGSRSHTALNYKTYNKLGSPASAGCIRMTVADAKWIYDHAGTGTPVKVVKGNSKTPGPLGKPATIKIKSAKVKYDPTDPEISDSTKAKDYKAKRISGYMKKNGTKVGY